MNRYSHLFDQRTFAIEKYTPQQMAQLAKQKNLKFIRLECKDSQSENFGLWFDRLNLSVFPNDLETLDLAGFPDDLMTQLDLNELSTYPKLRRLQIECHDMDFIDLRPLESCPSLTDLTVRGVIGMHLLSSPVLRTLDLSLGNLLYPYPLPDKYKSINSRINELQVLDFRQLDGCTMLEEVILRRNTYLRAIRLDAFVHIRTSTNLFNLPRIDLRGNKLVGLYVPQVLIPEDRTVEDYILADSPVTWATTEEQYDDLLKITLYNPIW
jgi:hypothetical protein